MESLTVTLRHGALQGYERVEPYADAGVAVATIIRPTDLDRSKTYNAAGGLWRHSAKHFIEWLLSLHILYCCNPVFWLQ